MHVTVTINYTAEAADTKRDDLAGPNLIWNDHMRPVRHGGRGGCPLTLIEVPGRLRINKR
jgi:hypothetical protein